uniref:hypothetical protein n=1 Tax=Ezakiella massiliensis TaxID=1852374 RepID=UPI00094EE826|nr:hypothetical protein [Ezakiella massiliensis]
MKKRISFLALLMAILFVVPTMVLAKDAEVISMENEIAKIYNSKAVVTAHGVDISVDLFSKADFNRIGDLLHRLAAREDMKNNLVPMGKEPVGDCYTKTTTVSMDKYQSHSQSVYYDNGGFRGTLYFDKYEIEGYNKIVYYKGRVCRY